MTSRQPRFEICRGDDGWWARFRAANGRVVFVSETYQRRRAAACAVLVVARAFWDDGFNTAQFIIDGVGVLFVTNGDGDYIEVREVDER